MNLYTQLSSISSFIATLFLLTGAAGASIVTFSDTNFANPDWSLTTVQKNNGGTIIANQSSVTVNTAPFARFVEHNINAGTAFAASSVAGLHLKNTASYDPSMQGAIDHICFSIDYDFETPSFGNVGLGALLHQNGRWYAGGYSGTGDGVGFTNYSTAPLASNQFVEVDLNNTTALFLNSSHPDFSASGSPMTFGFITANSNSTSNPIQFSRAYYFDDWAVSVKSVPEPQSAALLLVSGIAGMMYRRRT